MHERNKISDEPLHNGATHWSEMLEDIDELRSVIREHDAADDISTDLEDDGAALLFGSKKPLSFERVLLQFLPSRQKVDKLVSAYFRMETVAAPFIHPAQFLRLYRLFWDDTSTASPLWTSILFSTLEIASKTVFKDFNGNPASGEMADRFDTAAAHCLTIGSYYRPQRFAVEALPLYNHSKALTGADLGSDSAVLLGTLIRLATVMG